MGSDDARGHLYLVSTRCLLTGTLSSLSFWFWPHLHPGGCFCCGLGLLLIHPSFLAPRNHSGVWQAAGSLEACHRVLCMLFQLTYWGRSLHLCG